MAAPRGRCRCGGAAALLLVLLASWLPCSSSSNWAQLSGSNAQNTVSSDEHPPWSKRWGFASAVIQQVALISADGGGASVAGQSPSPSPQPKLTAPSVLLIMGGEDWAGDAARGAPGAFPTAATTGGSTGGASNGHAQDFLGNALLPNAQPMDQAHPDTGFGQLRNDVYISSGASWRVFTDRRQTNAFGEPLPVIASNVSWVATPPWQGFPPAYQSSGWKAYLGCCHVPAPFSCPIVNACPLNDKGRPYDDLVASRRWSPRRGAAAAVITPNTGQPAMVFVMGGRALTYSNMDPLDGAAFFTQTDTVHSPTQLMNDVWMSTDGGVTWDFTNAGCWVNAPDGTAFPGLKTLACSVDSDCYGPQKNLGPGSYCWFGPSASRGGGGGAGSAGRSAQGTCVCRHWSPREHHAATVSLVTGTPVLYVSGGVSATTLSRCGEWACGKATARLNTDVWSSGTLGQTWVAVTSEAVPQEASGRSDHGLIYASQALYLLGGRGSAEGDVGKDVFYDTAFTSNVGITWTQATAPQTYGPRAAFSLATDGNALYMFGGAVPVAPSPSPAPLAPVGAVEAATAAAGAAAVAAAEGRALKRAARGSGWSGAEAYAEARGSAPGELLHGLQRDVTNHFFALYLNDGGLATSAMTPAGAGALGQWYADFGNPLMPLQARYLWPRWPLAAPLDILNVSAADAAVLRDALRVTDAAGLAALAPSSIALCLDANQLNIPRVCAYKRAAQALVALCTPRFRPRVAWNYRLQAERGSAEGGWPLRETAVDDSHPAGRRGAPPDDGCLGEPGTASEGALGAGPVPDPYSGLTAAPGDHVCRSTPPPRRHGALLAMDGRLYAAGGWLAPNVYAADLWYRDAVPPTTRILHAPASGGGGEVALDTVLRLGCSESPCIYEARVFAGDAAAAAAGADGAPALRLTRDWALIPSEYECLPISIANAPVTLQVRAVDAAGNKDPAPLSVTWTYVPPVALSGIILGVLGVLAVLVLGYWAYRRWVRRRLLEGFAKRRLARAAAERARERRKYKKVKRLKTITVTTQSRPRAANVFSEEASEQQNRFKELLGVRASRNRAERIGLAVDPLAGQRVTSITPPKPGPPPDMHSAPTLRSAKEAAGFDAARLSQGPAHELEKQARAYGTLVASRKVGAGGEGVGAGGVGAGGAGGAGALAALPREGAAADFFRAGLQTHSDSLAALSRQGVSLERIPAGLAQKAAVKAARAAGRKEEDAWEISAMSKTLDAELAERTAQSKAKAAAKSAKKQ